MKKSDMVTIVTIALISMVAAYLVADAVIGRPNAQSIKVKTIDKMTSDVTQPDKTVFNKDAINPTVEVIIGTK